MYITYFVQHGNLNVLHRNIYLAITSRARRVHIWTELACEYDFVWLEAAHVR